MTPAHQLAQKYLERPQGARLTRAEHFLDAMKNAGVPDTDGPAFLRACCRASRHTTQHAIELDAATQGLFVNANAAVPEGGPTSRIARKKMPYVLNPEDLSRIQKIS